MEFSYGEGEYREGDRFCKGKIILSEHKLFLKNAQGDLTQSYIPLEKIERIRKVTEGLAVDFRPTMSMHYCAIISGEKKYLNELVKDLVERRGFKKRFLRSEWVENS